MAATVPTFNLGDRPRCTGTLKTTAGDPVDSDDVFFWVMNPARSKTTYHYGVGATLVRSAEGVYYADVDANLRGDWYYGFYSTGTAQAASADGKFKVLESKRS